MNTQNGRVGLIGGARGVLGLGLRLVKNKFNVVWPSLMRYMICCILLLFVVLAPCDVLCDSHEKTEQT